MYCWPEPFRPQERGEAGSVPAFGVARDKRCVGDAAKIDWGIPIPDGNEDCSSQKQGLLMMVAKFPRARRDQNKDKPYKHTANDHQKKLL